MKGISLDKIVSIEARKHDLANALGAPGLAPEEFVRLSKEYAAVEQYIRLLKELRKEGKAVLIRNCDRAPFADIIIFTPNKLILIQDRKSVV